MLRALLLLMSVVTPSGQPKPKQTADYTPAGQSLQVSWQLKRVPPPSPLYITPDDVLRVRAATNQANEVVIVNYRWLRASDATIQYGQFTVKPPQAVPGGAILDQPMAEGFLLSASCQATVATTRGQTFVRLFVNPKALGAGAPAYMLMADYVTTNTAPGFPNGRVTDPKEGPGWVHTVQFNNPPRGHDWGDTSLSEQDQRRFIQLTCSLQTSAVAGSRVPQFIVLDNLLNFVGVFIAGAVHPPSTTLRYTWSTAPILAPTIGTQMQVGAPQQLLLPPGYSVEVITSGLDTNAATGDVWLTIFETVEEWLDNV
jgi:hypothetical protein